MSLIMFVFMFSLLQGDLNLKLLWQKSENFSPKTGPNLNKSNLTQGKHILSSPLVQLLLIIHFTCLKESFVVAEL